MKEKTKNILMNAGIAILCVATILLEFYSITYVKDVFLNRMIAKIIQQGCGIAATILLMIRTEIKLFARPQNLLYLIPCLIIAVDNFPFWSYFSGNMHLVRNNAIDFVLFSGYCLSVGIFEECIFRGIVFTVLASRLSRDRNGFIKTYVISSFIFGAAHIMNGFSAATLLQVCYTTLTGGLFAFALIKTKNIFCCGVIHAIYNFCGLILSEQGMGTGIVFDVGTTITMAVISIIVGWYVLKQVFSTSNQEIEALYQKIGVKYNGKED